MSEHVRSADTDRPSTPPKALLVDPYIARLDPMERRHVELYPSLGLLSLASYLREHGGLVRIADLTFERDAAIVTRLGRTFRPHLVGVHTKTLTVARSLEVARRAHSFGALAVAGGPDAATRPDLYLDGGFDAVSLGEGEETLRELLGKAADGASIAGTPGTAVRLEGRTVRGPARPFLRPLDRLPLPAWDLVDLEAYLRRWERRTGERRMAVLTSRGCPFDCSWCSKPTFGRTFRQMSAERVVEELRALQSRYRVDYVRFCDDVFGIDRAWLERLLDRMESDRLGVKFECLARVDLLKPDLLARMRHLGLERVYVGVESGSQKMLDRMNRGTRLAQVERAAESLRENGIRQFWFLMLGYPGETVQDIEATLRLFRRFRPEEYSVSVALPIPGTRFYEQVRDRLKAPRGGSQRSAGRALLYEAAFPESFYHWEQARFDWTHLLATVRGKIDPKLLERLERAADALDQQLVAPLLIGRDRMGTERLSAPVALDAAPV